MLDVIEGRSGGDACRAVRLPAVLLAIGEKEGVVHVGCWAHTRRKVIEAFKVSGGEGSAGTLIAMIGSLYEIEDRLRAAFFQPDGTGDQDAFAKERRKESAPIFAQIESWLDTKSFEVPPQITLGRAISYTKAQWPRLIRYVDCPYLTPDNNAAERAIRPFTIGRNNWVTSGGPRGAFGSATLYSFMETAKACGREPYYYLRYVLTKLPTTEAGHIGSLLPWNVDPMTFGELTAEDARISLDSIPIA